MDVSGESKDLLQIINTRDMKFYVQIHNFIPDRCIPEFKLKKFEMAVTNSALWASSIFWICDGYSCARDIFRMSNLTTKMSNTFYGETIVEALLPLSFKVTREDVFNLSLETLGDIYERGDNWWAPIPDEIYKSKDGRDLNLEVICKMMVNKLFLRIMFIY